MTPQPTTIRRYRRTHSWDYARGASLFITISTAPRRNIFGRISGNEVHLSQLGKHVADALDAMPRLNDGLRLYGRVVMPDHIHFNVYLRPGLNEPLKVLGNAIRRFKNHTTKLAKILLADRSILAEYSSAISTTTPNISAIALAPTTSSEGRAAQPRPQGSADGRSASDSPPSSDDGRSMIGQNGQLWQQGYHDRLCLSRTFIDATERYIRYNPLKWALMHGIDHALRIHEPLDSPRLADGDYWKGVGNTALLGTGEKIVALRISRRCSSSQIAATVRRMEAAVDKGYIILSGFISPGEKAVRDMLCARADARFIRILPSCIPNARFKPESRYVPAFAAGRYLEIGRGNDEVAFGREACLDYNAEIIEIATAGEGVAVYWKPTGACVLADHRSANSTASGTSPNRSANTTTSGASPNRSAISTTSGASPNSSTIATAIPRSAQST